MRLSQKINKYPLLLLIAFLTGISVFGQTRNTITGKITDKKLNEYLPGAVVTLKGPSSHTTTTNANGQYLFVDIPKGSYQLSVTYINYNGFSADIDVPVTGTVKKDIDLISSTKDMATVTVVGSRFGQSKALNSQKEAMNIKNVVSEEQIERFPDMNTADVLQRVPGVTVQRSAGEGRFVGLRGTGPALTNVTVNGSLLATSNGTDRVVELDVINAGQLGGIEVTKVITPDMDANAIGGSINLKTRSAFDYKSRVFNVWAGVNNSAGAGFRSAINYSDKLGKNKKFGISLSASLTRTNRKETSNEQTWGDRTSTTNVAIPMALRAMTIRQSNNTRDRLGLSGQLEYKFSGKSRIWINGMFNKRWDDQFRNDLTAKIDQGKYVSDTIVTGTRFIKSTQDRVERQKATAVEFGGINYAGKLKIEYQATYSAAYTKKSEGQIAPEFRYNNVNVKLTDLDTKFPNFGITDGKNIYNSGMYTHDVTDYRIENTTNELYTGGIDFTLPMNLAKKSTGELKFGARHRTNNKSRGDSRQQWSWKGAAPLNLAQFEDPNQMLGGVQDGHYNMGYAINTQKYREFFNANQSATGFVATDRPDVAFGEPYNADEKVTGVYAMASQTFGKLLVLGGLRSEFVSTDYKGNNLVVNNKTFVSAEESQVKRSYNKFFPNLQFRYRANNSTNIRLAYSTGLAYPNFFDLVPYSVTNVDPATKDIVRGNGYLDPTTSSNYDFLTEHFFKGIGILSGGVFYKKLDRFIYSSITNPTTGQYAGYRITQPVNGEGANLLGAEISWQQQFSFLPGMFSGFGIYTNYTYTQSKNIELGSIERTDIDVLPQQMKHVGNLALTYEKYGLNARLAANFSGRYIDKVGQDSNNDEWVKNFTQFDFSASQRVVKHLDIFFEWQNIMNNYLYTYTGVETRSRKVQYSGTTLYLGVKWSLN